MMYRNVCNNIPMKLKHFDAIVNVILEVFSGVYNIVVFFSVFVSWLWLSLMKNYEVLMLH